jgi:hypothetical protein
MLTSATGAAGAVLLHCVLALCSLAGTFLTLWLFFPPEIVREQASILQAPFG